MQFQHKLALTLLGVIIGVLAIFLLIAFITGDNTNANNDRGGGVSQGAPEAARPVLAVGGTRAGG